MNEKLIEVRAVLKYLFIKGKSNNEILQELHAVYGENCIGLTTIKDRRNSFNNGNYSIFDKKRPGRPPITEYNEQIAQILFEKPYLSSRNIGEIVGLDKNTVKKIIEENLRMHKVNFKWIPHELNASLREQRVQTAKKLLSFFKDASSWTLDHVYTQDETWIYYENHRSSMWILNGKERPKVAKRNIQSKKSMISVFWTRKGIKSVVLLPNGQKFNKKFFLTNVVSDLQSKDKTQHKIFHFDNARPHMIDNELQQMGIERLPHPPYSPDLAPSDFFLFGYLKMRLEGYVFEDERELLATVEDELRGIPKDFFFGAFHEWKIRLKEVIRRDGDYIQ